MAANGEDTSRTRQLLAGKHILLTGTTGFVGKLVLEKLLRQTPEVGGVYLLIRGDARARFQAEIAASSVFESLKRSEPERFGALCSSRVHCIAGEITEPRFGLSRREFRALAERIDAIVNCAASVNFREELDRALTINTLSLQYLAELAEAAGNVPVVQVSTCYVNGFNRGDMREQVVAPARAQLPRHRDGYYEVGPLIAALQDKIEALRERYRGRELKVQLVALGAREASAHGWNDSYTFTKWLGEQLLLKAQRGYPLTILRPAIVESALRDPAPGWIEGVKVADAILLAYAREKVQFFPGRRSGVIDVIPADLVANSIVLSLAEQFLEPGEQRIYQCCSGARNPLTVGEFIDHLVSEARQNHGAYTRLFARRPRRPLVAVDRRLFAVVALCLRGLLGAVERLLAGVGLRRRLKLRRNLNTGIELSAIFAFYSNPQYVFHSEQLLALAERMGPADRELYPVDAAAIDWSNYLRKVHMAGLDRYALQTRKAAPVAASSSTGAVAAAAS